MFKKYGVFVLVVTALFGMLLAGIQYFANDSYTSESKIMVSLPQNESTTNADAIVANQEMIGTYSEIIKSDEFLEPIADQFENLDLEDLKSNIKVEKAENSYVFKVSMIGSSESEAKSLGEKITSAFEKNIGQYISVEKVKILSSNVSSSDRGGAVSILRSLLIGVLTGFCLSIGILLVREFIVFE
ncbi:capsular polysaccharide biosynthesis protein [Enterococcus thailandicus]|nr:capsular polysaccharide biosynthesis protein [Enterococcus thailandicus]